MGGQWRKDATLGIGRNKSPTATLTMLHWMEVRGHLDLPILPKGPPQGIPNAQERLHVSLRIRYTVTTPLSEDGEIKIVTKYPMNEALRV